MAERFQGTWKLISSKNAREFDKSIGMSEKELDFLAPFSDPANGLTHVFKISGDNIEIDTFLGGKKVYSDKGTFGVERDITLENVSGKMTTTMEGDKLIDVYRRSDLVDARLEHVISGNRMIVTSSSEKGVTSTSEFEKQ